MKLRAMVLALALAACGQTGEKQDAAPAAPAGPDPFSMNIDIGRYGAMLSQIEELTAGRPGAGEPEVTEPRDLARRLRETVWDYNSARSQLCARGLFADVACGPAYEPVWISEPATAAPTLEELQTRSEAVGAEVIGFWNAVCEDARTRAPEEERAQICPME
jgi:hypothetical protein